MTGTAPRRSTECNNRWQAASIAVRLTAFPSSTLWVHHGENDGDFIEEGTSHARIPSDFIRPGDY
ncbi:hypothetical protein [Pectobacterium aroidearum]|uniref:hypothetical protein n=1 Tax=Pectobacterium aroidearum TaxID=1201031 RepID=UPI0032EAF415